MPLQLSELWIYPVKSLGGLRLPEARVQEKGLRWDRRWMLVDADGRFMTQRDHHAMSQFKVELHNEGFLIHFHQDKILLPFDAETEDVFLPATVWDDSVMVRAVRGKFSLWFSAHLGHTCKLVHFPEDHARPVDPRFAHNDEQVSLADGFPFLLIGQSSLDDLNGRLMSPVPMNRFRPNLVFTGGAPFEEDQWKEFRIGDNRFKAVKPCARCVLTTVDQETGVAGKEPLRTLATYRTHDHKVMFGQNVIAIDHGKISEGSVITLG